MAKIQQHIWTASLKDTSSPQGYYFTGDGCRRDAHGCYTITGRVDDVINVSGHRVGTAEVEAALASHGACTEAAVVGYALLLTHCCSYPRLPIWVQFPDITLNGLQTNWGECSGWKGGSSVSIFYDCEADCAPECLVLPFGLLHVSSYACSLASCHLSAPWVREDVGN